MRAAVATGENLTGLDMFTPLLDARGVDVVQPGAAWGVTFFLRLAHAALSRDLPVSPVGLTAMPAVAHAASAVANNLSVEIQLWSDPVGVSIDEDYVDGGVLLSEEPGAGITIDEAVITQHREEFGDASWSQPRGPHVRDPRTCFRLLRDD